MRKLVKLKFPVEWGFKVLWGGGIQSKKFKNEEKKYKNKKRSNMFGMILSVQICHFSIFVDRSFSFEGLSFFFLDGLLLCGVSRRNGEMCVFEMSGGVWLCCHFSILCFFTPDQ